MYKELTRIGSVISAKHHTEWSLSLSAPVSAPRTIVTKQDVEGMSSASPSPTSTTTTGFLVVMHHLEERVIARRPTAMMTGAALLIPACIVEEFKAWWGPVSAKEEARRRAISVSKEDMFIVTKPWSRNGMRGCESIAILDMELYGIRPRKRERERERERERSHTSSTKRTTSPKELLEHIKRIASKPAGAATFSLLNTCVPKAVVSFFHIRVPQDLVCPTHFHELDFRLLFLARVLIRMVSEG
eukprot:TRINITY_DN4868_c0_g2_i2.p1 TRINITY_DN4868_c0_g2~~TRINITY_DN4868_c0_g2_i2.p1  ORF type:complete len:244 (+),score=18.05 TRINITY_DN4868_c0_g2_i2:203-934(+)